MNGTAMDLRISPRCLCAFEMPHHNTITTCHLIHNKALTDTTPYTQSAIVPVRSQTITEIKMLEMQILGWCGNTWSAVVRLLGCTAKLSETHLEMTYGKEMSYPYVERFPGGHFCSQQALLRTCDICGIVICVQCIQHNMKIGLGQQQPQTRVNTLEHSIPKRLKCMKCDQNKFQNVQRFKVYIKVLCEVINKIKHLLILIAFFRTCSVQKVIPISQQIIRNKVNISIEC